MPMPADDTFRPPADDDNAFRAPIDDDPVRPRRRTGSRQTNGWYTFCKVMAYLWVIFGGLILAVVVFAADTMFAEAEGWFVILLGGLTFAQIVSGVGIIMRKRWGRISGFVFAALGLTNFPIGTVLSALMLVGLSKSGECFD